MSKCNFVLAINGFKFKISGQGVFWHLLQKAHAVIVKVYARTRDVVVAEFLSKCAVVYKGCKKANFQVKFALFSLLKSALLNR